MCNTVLHLLCVETRSCTKNGPPVSRLRSERLSLADSEWGDTRTRLGIDASVFCLFHCTSDASFLFPCYDPHRTHILGVGEDLVDGDGDLLSTVSDVGTVGELLGGPGR